MGVSKYVVRGKARWRVDTYLTLPDGSTHAGALLGEDGGDFDAD